MKLTSASTCTKKTSSTQAHTCTAIVKAYVKLPPTPLETLHTTPVPPTQIVLSHALPPILPITESPPEENEGFPTTSIGADCCRGIFGPEFWGMKGEGLSYERERACVLTCTAAVSVMGRDDPARFGGGRQRILVSDDQAVACKSITLVFRHDKLQMSNNLPVARNDAHARTHKKGQKESGGETGLRLRMLHRVPAAAIKDAIRSPDMMNPQTVLLLRNHSTRTRFQSMQALT